MTPETSSPAYNTAIKVLTTEISSRTAKTTKDAMTTIMSGTSTDVKTTEISSRTESTDFNTRFTETTTIFQTTTETPTPMDSTTTAVLTSEIVSLLDTSISDVQMTASPSTIIDLTATIITTGAAIFILFFFGGGLSIFRKIFSSVMRCYIFKVCTWI